MLALLALAGLNLWIFRDHYFADFGFPWDFLQAYYASAAYSFSAHSAGVIPEWMPYQCSGYPFLQNPQTAFFYAPFVLLGWLHVDYTMHLAVVLQCLHVFLGACGAFFLLRRLTGDVGTALVGAVAYHFFGGFYGNSQHPDIIRAFSLLPWVFHSLTLTPGPPLAVSRAALLAPFWVGLLITGGYPGNQVATALAAGLYVVAQVVVGCSRGTSARRALTIGVVLLTMAGLGLALAAVYLGPVLLGRDAFHRAGAVETMRYAGLWSVGLASLFLPTDAFTIPVDITMRSCFVALPAVLFALLGLRRRSEHAVALLVVLIFSLFMSGGPASPVWRALAELLPPVKLSRFPTSDYRPLIALAIVAFAALGLRSLTDGAVKLKALGVASGLLGAAFVGVTLHTDQALAQQLGWGVVVIVSSVLVLALRWRHRDWRHAGWLSIVAWVGLIVVDAQRVLPQMKTWRHPEVSSLYAKNRWSLQSPRDLAHVDGLEKVLERRPPRKAVGDPAWFGWAGYLDGSFMTGDRARCLLLAGDTAQRRGKFAAFAAREWTPLLLAPEDVLEEHGGLQVEPHVLDRAGNVGPGRSVVSLRYEPGRIEYQVELSSTIWMVENEIYARGWDAVVEDRSALQRIEPLPLNEVFRAWRLPPGSYRMVSQFRTPGLRGGAWVSGLALLLWVAAAISWRRLEGWAEDVPVGAPPLLGEV